MERKYSVEELQVMVDKLAKPNHHAKTLYRTLMLMWIDSICNILNEVPNDEYIHVKREQCLIEPREWYFSHAEKRQKLGLPIQYVSYEGKSLLVPEGSIVPRKITGHHYDGL